MNRNRKILFIGVIISGLIVPFIPELFLSELIILPIPFILISTYFLYILFVSTFTKPPKVDTAFYIIPIFILSQLFSCFTVNKIQRIRGNRVINKIESFKIETGFYPDEYNLSLGLEYRKLNEGNNFVIEYSRGFFVREKYYSEHENWGSYGWND